MFVRLLNDQEFVRQLDIRNRNHTEPVAHKILKELLFGEQTAVLFLNIQEDVGKIVKVSKNLPAVLGYASSSLVGQSVN